MRFKLGFIFLLLLAPLAFAQVSQHSAEHTATTAAVLEACDSLQVAAPGEYRLVLDTNRTGLYQVFDDGSFTYPVKTEFLGCALALVVSPAPTPEPTPQPTPTPGPTPAPLATVTPVNSVTQYGITWTFADTELVGNFVTGDYFVVDDGDVTVVSVSPEPGGGRNGSMLNPVVGSHHGFDDRTRDGYEPAYGVVFPLQVNGGDALLSSISRGSESGDWAGATIDDKARLNTVAVLTIVATVPPANAFRPSYVDRSQTIYTAAQINFSAIPTLDPANYTVERPMSYYLRGIERPWILFLHEWPGRDIHPHQNMKGYQQRIGEYLSELSLAIMLDTPEREELIRRYVQLGIDYYQIGISGNGDGDYFVAPVIIAGKLLSDDAMLNAFINGVIQSVPRDYPDFYFYADRNDTTVSAIVPAGQTYTGYNVFFRNNLAANRGYEHLDPTEWHLTSKGQSEAQKDETYRNCCDSHPHVGMVLAARMCGLEQQWNHPATFEYIERWMIGEAQGSRSAFVDSVFLHW